jgi:hypothetical protein
VIHTRVDGLTVGGDWDLVTARLLLTDCELRHARTVEQPVDGVVNPAHGDHSTRP